MPKPFTLHNACFVLALLCFILAALKLDTRFNLQAAGLAFWLLSLLIRI